jgi:hypothetical protein
MIDHRYIQVDNVEPHALKDWHKIAKKTWFRWDGVLYYKTDYDTYECFKMVGSKTFIWDEEDWFDVALKRTLQKLKYPSKSI